MRTNCRLEEISDVLRTRQRFVILSHLRPDGDALGCELAMALCLKQLGKNSEYHLITSAYGHDSFLLEHETFAPLVRDFLERV